MSETVSHDELREKLELAAACVRNTLPHVAPMLAAMDIRFDERVRSAAVSATGRLFIAPSFAARLTAFQLAFVVAHELYHVLYGVFDRFDERTSPDRRWLVNVAHDFIVNDMLCRAFCEAEGLMSNRYQESKFVPHEGLFWFHYRPLYHDVLHEDQPPIESFSLESLVVELERIRDYLPREDEDAFDVAFGGFTAGCGRDGERQMPELLPDGVEREMTPPEGELERRARVKRLSDARRTVTQAESLPKIIGEMMEAVGDGGGEDGGAGDALVAARDGAYSTPWESVLQKWCDDFAPPRRSWAHASRRAGGRTDIVLPGRCDDGYMINILLDTSGSMTSLLPAVLGMIQAFGRSSGVRCARILQCDAALTSDEIVDIDDLARYELKGFGGSDMRPGLRDLSSDGTVESVLVVTDGCIAYPPSEEVPYDVLWLVLSAGGNTDHFNPGYGRVVGMPTEDLVS